MNGKLTVFKIFEDMYTKRSKGELWQEFDFESVMSNFMICRLFRMNDSTVWIAEKLNKYQNILSKKDFYQFAYSLVPFRPRAPFCDFIKKPQKKDEKESQSSNKHSIDEDGYLII